MPSAAAPRALWDLLRRRPITAHPALQHASNVHPSFLSRPRGSGGRPSAGPWPCERARQVHVSSLLHRDWAREGAPGPPEPGPDPETQAELARLRAPQQPGPEDCCQSGCVVCVWDLYDDALDAYEERRDEVLRLGLLRRAAAPAERQAEGAWGREGQS